MLNLTHLAGFSNFAPRPWNIFDIYYENKSLSIAAQETVPTCLAFSPDGTKAYVGGGNLVVYQYTLSTAWDISTGSYASKSMSVAGQMSGALYSIAFSADGTKLYAGFGAVSKIWQYTLSTPWDISTGSYASKFLSVAGFEASHMGLVISPDGTRVIVAGTTNDAFESYTLSTPWDISTGGGRDGNSIGLLSDATGYQLVGSPDGKTIFVLGWSMDAVTQYDLGAAWIITDPLNRGNRSVTSQDSTPKGLAFSADGIKMYMVGQTNDTIYQYALV